MCGRGGNPVGCSQALPHSLTAVPAPPSGTRSQLFLHRRPRRGLLRAAAGSAAAQAVWLEARLPPLLALPSAVLSLQPYPGPPSRQPSGGLPSPQLPTALAATGLAALPPLRRAGSLPPPAPASAPPSAAAHPALAPHLSLSPTDGFAFPTAAGSTLDAPVPRLPLAASLPPGLAGPIPPRPPPLSRRGSGPPPPSGSATAPSLTRSTSAQLAGLASDPPAAGLVRVASGGGLAGGGSGTCGRGQLRVGSYRFTAAGRLAPEGSAGGGSVGGQATGGSGRPPAAPAVSVVSKAASPGPKRRAALREPGAALRPQAGRAACADRGGAGSATYPMGLHTEPQPDWRPSSPFPAAENLPALHAAPSAQRGGRGHPYHAAGANVQLHAAYAGQGDEAAHAPTGGPRTRARSGSAGPPSRSARGGPSVSAHGGAGSASYRLGHGGTALEAGAPLCADAEGFGAAADDWDLPPLPGHEAATAEPHAKRQRGWAVEPVAGGGQWPAGPSALPSLATSASRGHGASGSEATLGLGLRSGEWGLFEPLGGLMQVRAGGRREGGR
jgi:hypothetical protein